MQHIFIIGSKGIPARYGGFETFVDKLVSCRKSKNIKYHVACLAKDKKDFDYNGARCFNIKVPNLGAAKAVIYDVAALKSCIEYIKSNNISGAIIYILACRIGPFIGHYKRMLDKLGCKLYVNPDGHEWKRAKWNFAIKRYWKLSEKLMVKHADLLICDSKAIEKYIKYEYKQYDPETAYISYGADTSRSILKDDDISFLSWLNKNNVKVNKYYLVVGRFVPENNYETMIKEFMASNTHKDLVLITNVDNNKFLNRLKKTTGFEKDERIKFAGTVYDRELLKKIRENAFGYLHGHEVGGTNPSLLEALGSTKLNLLLNVEFNREVAEDGALYWSKETGSLAGLIDKAEKLSSEEIAKYSARAKARIEEAYDWENIVDNYENVFQACEGVHVMGEHSSFINVS